MRIGPSNQPAKIHGELLNDPTAKSGGTHLLATDTAARGRIEQRVQAGFGKYPSLKGRVQTGFTSTIETKLT